MNKTKLSLLIPVSLAISACSTVVNGTYQSVSVLTPPTQGAQCVLENNKGKWYVNKTPGSVQVHKSYRDLTVICQKEGYRKGEATLKSKTQAAAFGNVIIGGAIGAGVDVVNGAAYQYPMEVRVPMSPLKSTHRK